MVVIYANIALYALCFQLQRPIEPFLIEKLGAKGADASMSYGTLQSFFNIIQTLGSVAMGLILDKVGARWSFVICYVASALSYFLLSISTSLTVLYLSKVPTFFQAGFLVAQALIAQETSSEDRAEALGRATTAYTIGATVGPLVGGWLGASGDYYVGARWAVLGSLLSAALSFLLPATGGSMVANAVKEEKEEGTPKTNGSGGRQGISKMIHVASRPIILAVLGTKLYASIGASIQQTVFPLILKDGFGMAEAGMGMTMSTMMIINSFVGAFVVGPCTNSFTPALLVPLCIASKGALEVAGGLAAPGMMVSTMLSSAMPAFLPFLGCCVAGTVFQYMLATTLSAISTSSVAKDEQGSLMGVDHAMFSIARIGTPAAATFFLRVGGVPLVTAVCAGISFTLLVGVKAYVLPRCNGVAHTKLR